MENRLFVKLFRISWVTVLAVVLSGSSFWPLARSEGRPLTFAEMMAFKQIEGPVISGDGQIVAFTARPDRGNPEVIVCTGSEGCVYQHELGSSPVVSSDSSWVAAEMEVDLVLSETKKDADPALRKGMLLFDIRENSWEEIPRVRDFAFSDDGKWMAYHRFPPEEKVAPDGDSAAKPSSEEAETETSELVLRDLRSGVEFVSGDVDDWIFAPESESLVFSRSGTGEGRNDGLYQRRLIDSPGEEELIQSLPEGKISSLAWTEEGDWLAWGGEPPDGDASTWIRSTEEGKSNRLEGIPEGWYVPLENELEWSKDGERLYFGIKPIKDKEFASDAERKVEDADYPEAGSAAGEAREVTEEDLKKVFDIQTILDRKEMDVWHWNDPRIITNQKERWKEKKDRIFLAMALRENPGIIIQLADLDLPEAYPSQSEKIALGRSQVPYLKLITWEGSFYDLYVIDQGTGRKTRFAEKAGGDASLSPSGEFVAYYLDGDWHLYETATGETRNLTSGLDVSFANELHDYPSVVPGYGSAGWLEDSSAFLVYDRYDIWRFPSSGEKPVNITEGKGRREQIVFRAIRTDPDREYWEEGQDILLSSYRDKLKNHGFYKINIASPGVEKLLEDDKKFTFLAKAEDSDSLIYTREDYREFPDIWKSGTGFGNPRKLSDVNPDISDFAWGEAELVEWNSLDGVPLQGVLIKPGNLEEGRKYPVIVYFYRYFSQRLHEFNTPVINHRPCFPLYASNGYAVFLPDIRFEVGRPGFASTKCLVPGVQKLVDMGIADPDAIGLHGHSWSGYQTAFIVTQTDIFAAAVAGAPVSNMTSAYGGIRWGSGLSRQFQYEKTQSRIGGSLWEFPERYIENSPLFFADRINTPLLIMFGDQDDAVPWYQGIELYMAMRRLEKDSVFLQYRGEPHHLKKYPNRLDYAIKMKEYFDHYLKGSEAPDWISGGEPYRGD